QISVNQILHIRKSIKNNQYENVLLDSKPRSVQKPIYCYKMLKANKRRITRRLFGFKCSKGHR
ncbi:hypothetical protein AM627_16320, partial [Vibrio cholerae O1 biovar El Tor]